MTKAAAFRQADVTRAARGAVKAGLSVAKIEVEPNGKIVVLTTSARGAEESGENEWDEVFDEPPSQAA